MARADDAGGEARGGLGPAQSAQGATEKVEGMVEDEGIVVTAESPVSPAARSVTFSRSAPIGSTTEHRLRRTPASVAGHCCAACAGRHSNAGALPGEPSSR